MAWLGLIASLLSCGEGMLFGAIILLLILCILLVGLLLAAFLTESLFSSLGVVYEKEKLSLFLISIYLLYRGLLLWIFILLWYRTDDVSEWVDNPLELLMLKEANLSLVILVLMLMSMFDRFWAIGMKRDILYIEISKENNVFTNPLLSATMWDGGTKKRSNGHIPLHYPKEKNKIYTIR